MSENSQSDLQSLRNQLAELEAAIQDKKREEVKVLVDGFAKKLKSLDLSIETAIKELTVYAPNRASRSRIRASRSDAFVLYANPADPKQTWGGVGRKPNWVNAYLASGGDIEKLKV